ncbi:MAG: mechanosensitive ion channel domain-containing protein [Eubacteriales bacterium]
MPQWLQNLWDTLRANADTVLRFILVLVVGYLLIRLLLSFVKRAFGRSKIERAIVGFITQLIKIALYIVYIISLCSLLGIPTTSLVALLSAGALTVSLAMQNSLSNIASGFLILSNKIFKVGDTVEAAGVSGVVQSVNIMRTVLLTFDNKVVSLPNNAVMNANITNLSAHSERMLDMTVTVGARSDIEQVKGILMDILSDHEKVLKDKEMSARLKNRTLAALDFSVRVWTRSEDYAELQSDLLETITARLAALG